MEILNCLRVKYFALHVYGYNKRAFALIWLFYTYVPIVYSQWCVSSPYKTFIYVSSLSIQAERYDKHVPIKSINTLSKLNSYRMETEEFELICISHHSPQNTVTLSLVALNKSN